MQSFKLLVLLGAICCCNGAQVDSTNVNADEELNDLSANLYGVIDNTHGKIAEVYNLNHKIVDEMYEFMDKIEEAKNQLKNFNFESNPRKACEKNLIMNFGDTKISLYNVSDCQNDRMRNIFSPFHQSLSKLEYYSNHLKQIDPYCNLSHYSKEEIRTCITNASETVTDLSGKVDNEQSIINNIFMRELSSFKICVVGKHDSQPLEQFERQLLDVATYVSSCLNETEPSIPTGKSGNGHQNPNLTRQPKKLERYIVETTTLRSEDFEKPERLTTLGNQFQPVSPSNKNNEKCSISSQAALKIVQEHFENAMKQIQTLKCCKNKC